MAILPEGGAGVKKNPAEKDNLVLASRDGADILLTNRNVFQIWAREDQWSC
jgi:hypothetical protein